MMPTAQSFGTRMSKLGVSDTATIVVYEQRGVFSAPRARWMLRSFGAKDVSLLDGGLEAWLAAGLPTKAGDVERPAAVFQAQLDEGCIVDLQTLRSLLSQRTQVLDARSTGRFTGEAPEPRAGLRSGHMPGATSLPFTELVAKGRMKSTDDLAALFASRGIRVNEPVVASCGSGVTAAVLLLGLELLGAPDTRLYDGSWAEYAQQPDAVIVTGSAPEVS
jgi:thiosulfate/3-mercaptopyruvate sulfurtransferase